MLIVINYANDKFQKAQKLNTKTAKKYGADKVIEYGPDDIDDAFKEAHSDLLGASRGGGFWVWKPYVIEKTLHNASEGDYVVYLDSGCAVVNELSFLIDLMEKEAVDVMPFCINQKERLYSKRDALILVGVDNEKTLESAQICGTYIIVKNSPKARDIIHSYLMYSCDRRIVSDDENVMGLPNYPEFIDNRHDQTVWSLLCKKNNILPYRDPSQYGNNAESFEKEVIDRSDYPQIFDSHRLPNIRFYFQLDYYNQWYNRLLKNIYSYVAIKFGKIRNTILKR